MSLAQNRERSSRMTLQHITPDVLVIGVLTPIPNPAIIKENECLSVPKKRARYGLTRTAKS